MGRFGSGALSLERANVCFGPAVRFFAWSLHPDGTLLAAGCRSGLVQVWNLKTGSALELRHGRAISHVDFAAGGQVLVTASEDRTARFWDVQSGEPAASTVVHERPLVWAEITADRRRVMTAGLDGAIRSWELDTHFDAECRLKPTGPLSSVQLSPDEQSLLLTQREGPAIRRLRGPELIATSLGRSVADCGAFSPDGRVRSLRTTKACWNSLTVPGSGWESSRTVSGRRARSAFPRMASCWWRVARMESPESSYSRAASPL